MADPGPIATECVNCGRESHFLGVACWYGVAMVAPVCLLALGVVGFSIWAIFHV